MVVRGVPPYVRWAAMRRALPLAVLAAGFVAFFLLGLGDYLSLEALRASRFEIGDWVARNEELAVAAYVAAYIAIVALSVPGATVMTIAGGFLFGTVMATACTTVAATIGASVLFLAARHALADLFAAKAGRAVRRMEAGFRRDALSYLVFLRLMPVFPFWLVNLVPALLGVPLRVFILGTAIGIIPATLIYAGIGDGLAAVFERGDKIDLALLGQPRVLVPLLGLALLALLPPVVRAWRLRHGENDASPCENDP